MHALLYVTFPKELAKNSEDARRFVYNSLIDGGFVESAFMDETEEEPSSFPCRCDWFVIGGRWSGYLLLNRYPKLAKYVAELRKDQNFCDARKERLLQKFINQKMPGLKKYKFQFFYPDLCYETYGQKCDAMIVDSVLYRKVVIPALEVDDYYDGGGIIDLVDQDALYTKENTVRKRWIVVVDFHY